MEGYDRFIPQPGLDSDVYIDDQGLAAAGASKTVIFNIVSGARRVHSIVGDVSGCSFAVDQTTI
eukprot:3169146-Pyramimonas_sp.AAC.1